jgi:hypothetical protein
MDRPLARFFVPIVWFAHQLYIYIYIYIYILLFSSSNCHYSNCNALSMYSTYVNGSARQVVGKIFYYSSITVKAICQTKKGHSSMLFTPASCFAISIFSFQLCDDLLVFLARPCFPCLFSRLFVLVDVKTRVDLIVNSNVFKRETI